MSKSSEPLGVWPGDWLVDMNSPEFRVCKVKSAYRQGGKVFVDCYLYSPNGDRLPRRSPSEGGPTTFEPALDLPDFKRIKKPSFPIDVRVKWVRDKETNTETARTDHFKRHLTIVPFRTTEKARRTDRARIPSRNHQTSEGPSLRLAAEHLRDVARSLSPEVATALKARASELEQAAARADAPMRT